MPTNLVRLVTRDPNGDLRTREFDSFDELLASHDQIGIDDCSTDLDLRCCPVFRGLVGPIPDGKGIARYETPEVFESLTKEWANTRVRRRRRKPAETGSATLAGPVILGSTQPVGGSLNPV